MKGYTREDHQDVANQLFSCYAKVGDARALASVIGEDELSPLDKKYLIFGKAFEREFIGQGARREPYYRRYPEHGLGAAGTSAEEKSWIVSIRRFWISITMRPRAPSGCCPRREDEFMDPNTFPTKG